MKYLINVDKKKVLGCINKYETPSNGENVFDKGKDDTPN